MQRDLAELALAEERLVIISTLDRENAVFGKRLFSSQDHGGQVLGRNSSVGWGSILPGSSKRRKLAVR